MLVSARKTRMDFSNDNLLSHFKLSFEECVSVVLKENFTDPLIDVLLSYPPSSTLNKTDDLELIEILARHHFQRKGMLILICTFSTLPLLKPAKDCWETQPIVFVYESYPR